MRGYFYIRIWLIFIIILYTIEVQESKMQRTTHNTTKFVVDDESADES